MLNPLSVPKPRGDKEAAVRRDLVVARATDLGERGHQLVALVRFGNIFDEE
jgi:hypothetical protein